MTLIPDPGPGPGPASLPVVYQAPGASPAVVSPATPAHASSLDFVGLLRSLRRCWPLAVGGGLLLGALVTGIVYAVLPSAKYTARAMFHVNSVPPKILLQVREAFTDYGAYQRTQLALIKSRLVLNRALKEALKQDKTGKLKGVAEKLDPIEWLEKEVQVDFANGSEILRISMSGDSPEVPRDLVNALVEAYQDEVVDAEAKQRRERYELLKQTWNRYQEGLREKRLELKRLSEVTGSDDKRMLTALQQNEMARLGRAEDELARVRSELRTLTVELEVLKAEEAAGVSAVSPEAVEEALGKDHSIEALTERVARARRAYEDVYRLSARNPSDPALQKRRKEWSDANAALVAHRRKLYPEVEHQLQERARGDRGPKLDELRLRIKLLSKQEELFDAAAKRLETRSQTISKTSVDVAAIQEEIGSAEEVAKAIGAEVEALNVELQANPRIRLLERAETPRTKDETRPLRMAGLAGFGTFAVALVAVSLLEFRARRVDSPDEVVRGLGVQLVGILPNIPGGKRKTAPDDPRSRRWQNLLVESVDAARTSLLHASRRESVRAVMVASALGGEGKTSLACHLACSLARAGRRTVLIDGDLRCPTAHLLFDLTQEPGLCDVLRGDAGITDVILPTAVDRLSLIPAGCCDSQAIQALASTGFWDDLERLKERFDFILIDSSPVLPVADALLIGQHVDGVILSVMRGVSRLPKVQAAYERMSYLGIRMLGAIVTGARCEGYGSAYGYAYAGRSRDQRSEP
jgi:capsular exopolysaccharide synthesis family protein